MTIMTMRTVFTCLAVSVAFGSNSAFSAETNTGVLTVTAIKGNYITDETNNIYHYSFSGTWGQAAECNGSFVSKSGDPNINQILQMAYLSGIPIKAGINTANSCVITTVELQSKQT